MQKNKLFFGVLVLVTSQHVNAVEFNVANTARAIGDGINGAATATQQTAQQAIKTGGSVLNNAANRLTGATTVNNSTVVTSVNKNTVVATGKGKATASIGVIGSNVSVENSQVTTQVGDSTTHADGDGVACTAIGVIGANPCDK